MSDATSAHTPLETLMARSLGAGSHVWIVTCETFGQTDAPWWGHNETWAQDLADALGIDAGPALFASSLGGSPLGCVDLRALGRDARRDCRLLVVDNTIPTSLGCAALRLGAHVAMESLDRVAGERERSLLAVGVSVDALQACAGLADRLDGLRAPADAAAEALAAYEAFSQRRQGENDAAIALASYLVCHPRVERVWYPGLLRDQADASQADARNAVAPQLLTGGFGPVVDFALSDAPSQIQRHVCDSSDPLAQIASFEASLAV